jgi:hypothetical protein
LDACVVVSFVHGAAADSFELRFVGTILSNVGTTIPLVDAAITAASPFLAASTSTSTTTTTTTITVIITTTATTFPARGDLDRVHTICEGFS